MGVGTVQLATKRKEDGKIQYKWKYESLIKGVKDKMDCSLL